MQAFIESLGIDFRVVLAQSIAFLALLGIVWKFLFGPVSAIMQQREEQIANSLAGAEAHNMKAESLRKEYEAHLTQIADEARARMEQAMKDAEGERQRMLESTQEDIRTLHQRHQTQLTQEYEQLRRELRAEMSDIAVMAATSALRRQMTPELQSAVIDQVIRELEQPAGRQA